MDPKACFIAWLNAPFAEQHHYYNDLCDWFARGGFGFDVRVTTARGYYAAATLTKLTATGDAHVTYRNQRKGVVRKDALAELSNSCIL